MKSKMQEMVLTSIFGAIIILLGIIPNVGYIRIGVASFTIIHIPVIVGLFILGFRSNLILGGIFGLSSLLAALMYASEPFDLAFINPLISVLPRVLFALSGYYILVLFKWIAQKKSVIAKPVIYGIITIITGVGVYFGGQTLVKTVVYSEFESKIAQIRADGIEAELSDADIKIEVDNYIAANQATYDTNYENVRPTWTIIIIVVILILAGVYGYLVFFSKFSEKHYYIPSVFLLSTFIHTVLVLAAVVIFKPSLFAGFFGDNQAIIAWILGLALTNGLVEAIFAALIGSPIVVALMNRLEVEEE